MIALAPNEATGWANKGVVLHSLRRYQEELAALDQALALDPSDTMSWLYKAGALHALGREAEAQEAEARAKALGG